MKKKFSLSLSMLVAMPLALHGMVPFNPQLDTSGFPIAYSINQSTNQAVTNIAKDIQKGKLPIFHDPVTFTLNRSYQSNASRRGPDGTVYVYDQNWKSSDSKSKEGTSLKIWVDWKKEDRKYNRLFRPFVFYDVMGLMERNFQKTIDTKKFDLSQFPILDEIKKTQKNPDPKDPTIQKLLQAFPGRKALLGSQFECVSIADLRKELALQEKNNAPAKKPGEFKILDGFKIAAGDTKYLQEWGIKQKKNENFLETAFRETDILYLQETNPGDAFQIASNLNCLEGGMGNPTTRLEEMQKGAVQGENASLGSMGGTIIRKYAYHHKKPINILEHVTGVTVGTDGLIQKLPKAGLTDNDIPDMQVGIHKNVMVTSGYYPPILDGKIPQQYQQQSDYLQNNKIVSGIRTPYYIFNTYMSNEVRIDQIFTAALDISPLHTNAQKLLATYTKKALEETAKVILKGGYEGTILAAALAGDKKLYLTFVGGNAFKNDLQWILDALDSDYIQRALIQSGMDVILVVYPLSLIKKPITNFTSAQKSIYDTINSINTSISKRPSKTNKPKPKPQELTELARALTSMEQK